MATILDRVNLKIALSWIYRSSLDLSDPKDDFNYIYADSMLDGNGLDLAQVGWHDSQSVAASGTNSIDMAGGLTDAFGNTLTLTKLKGLLIRNKSTTAGDIIHVVRPATDGFALLGADGDLLVLHPGALILYWNPSAAGITITGGDTDNIDITEVGTVNAVAYDIILIGTDT